MASSSFSGRRGQRPVRKSSAPSKDADDTRLSRELEEIRKHELELKKKEVEMQRLVADLPRQIEEQERKQREMIRIRAVATATTADGFNRPRDKRYAAGRSTQTPRRRTRPEERSARMQFLMLCLTFAAILFLLFKSLPH